MTVSAHKSQVIWG